MTAVLREEVVRAGVAGERVVVMPNGVLLDPYRPRSEDPDSEGPLVLGFIGFVRSWHGLDGVIEAMARHGDTDAVTLTIIGDGPARGDLEQQAMALGVADRVRFTGVIDHAGVPDAVAGFDIALQPKVVAYASPLKIFDYMAAGCAIVAPDQPNIREILQHERTALLFDPDVPGALWHAILRLLRDPELRQILAVAARRELEVQDYTWQGNARRIVDLAVLPGQSSKFDE